MRRILVQTTDFDTGAELAALEALPGVGGIASFVGTVRGRTGEKTLTALTLEHYPGMTERALTGIAQQAEARWPLLGCIIIHRVGTLSPGARIVLAAAASAHRQAALEATGFLIDWLKTSAPFWKREDFTDHTTNWVEARDADHEAASRW
jgi:molybdopterin synthase catalytic subunit